MLATQIVRALHDAMIAYPVYALLAIGLAGDCVTTYMAFSRGLREANPIMGWMQREMGVAAAVIVAHLVIYTVFLLGGPSPAAWAMAAIYCGVTVWNTVSILRARRL